ncbi:MAG: corrinoid protein [Actinobacteria bacterium]|nr:corrinoid protein [Actinomycetota bacterium]MCG2820028.1 corrinoid protein [Actinomycetes bacterium]MBU4219862.1 corrinoid protein [Actinomycetota bacterium]MBU4358845.1 corrinoid protein [Actinomycetota bacterium]MBU4401118.1 corrinoid protein [Actinomycetota bacterium]
MKGDELLQEIELNVVQGRRNSSDEGLDEDLSGTPGVTELVEDALNRGIGAKGILVDAISSGMTEVGERYEKGMYFLPDMLAAAETVEAAMEILEPYLLKAGIESRGKIVLATVKGDLHDIGKNIVGLMLKGTGYSVIDLGNNVDPDDIVSAVVENEANMLGLSALLTTTMHQMSETIEAFSGVGFRDKVKVMVGGAPISSEFAEEIGADGYGKDAFEALKLADDFTDI